MLVKLTPGRQGFDGLISVERSKLLVGRLETSYNEVTFWSAVKTNEKANYKSIFLTKKSFHSQLVAFGHITFGRN